MLKEDAKQPDSQNPTTPKPPSRAKAASGSLSSLLKEKPEHTSFSRAALSRARKEGAEWVMGAEGGFESQVEQARNEEAAAEDELAKTATVEEKAEAEKATAKAGKRSAKAIKEAAEAAEKEARKASGEAGPQSEEAAEKKGPKPIVRPHIERRGKNYRNAAKQLEAGKAYGLPEALELATKTSPSKFDGTVELHVNLGVDPRQADQNIRSTVALPHGTGKVIRVAVFAPGDQHQAAEGAGADLVLEDEFLQQLEKGELNFDVLIATPQFMPKLGKYARVLGPRGLMPNPKSGTVAANVAAAVKAAKAGRVEYRVDKQSIIHLGIGKVSFGPEKLLDNAKAFFESLGSVKPSSLKGVYITAVAVSTTMGPGINVDLAKL